MRVVLKIVLLVVIMAIALFFGGVLLYVAINGRIRFDISFFVLSGLCVIGLLSAWFHIKTVKIYRLDSEGKLLPKPSKVFWAFNIGNAGALIFLSGWIFYLAFLSFGGGMRVNTSEDIVFLLFLTVPVLVGGFILFESFVIKKLLKKNKERQLILEIDNIKGDQER